MNQTKCQPGAGYTERRNRFEADRCRFERLSLRFSYIRLAVVLSTLAAGWVLYPLVSLRAVLAIAGVAACVFAVLAIRHETIISRQRRAAMLVEINDAGLRRVQGGWTTQPDDGEDLLDRQHPCAWDLDLLGPGSVFQWITAATTHHGRRALRDLLCQPPTDPDDIQANQAAMGELGPDVDWRQRFQVEGAWESAAARIPDDLSNWARDGASRPVAIPGLAGLRWLPLLPLTLLVVPLPGAYIIASTLILAQSVIWSVTRHLVRQSVAPLTAHRHTLAAHARLARLIENAPFHSARLAGLRAVLRPEGGRAASRGIRSLLRVVENMDVRHSGMLHFLLNLFLLWDLQFVAVANAWQRRHGRFLSVWFGAIAEWEALSSLSAIRFENPDWSFPVIERDGAVMEAAGMGHPLIPAAARVSNDFSLGRTERIAILTGSNMTGKSTWLRAVGVNLVLARCGAPVCASSLRTSPFDVVTSMRVVDSIEKRESTFYAELLRIKIVVDAARSGRPVFFLMDELFRGTNSTDRRLATIEVLRSLLKPGVLGINATHDLDISKLEAEDPEHFRNFHFEDYIVDGRLAFDYKLRSGVTQMTNAMHLIRSMGILGAEPGRGGHTN